MQVVSEATLDAFRNATTCEYCRLTVRTGIDPHHLAGRGIGGGSRLDVRCLLMALCRECHTRFHAGNIDRKILASIVARRERTTPEAIEAVLWLLRRLPKGATMLTKEESDGMDADSQALARRVFEEINGG